MESKFVLDKKEEDDLERITKAYNKFLEPSLVSKMTNHAKKTVTDITPIAIKDLVKTGLNSISEAELWNQVMKMAGEGFILLQGVSSKYTISEKDIIKKFKKNCPNIDSLEKIKTLRGYEIEKVVNSLDLSTYVTTILQSAPTGAIGVAGLAPNIILSTFIQFRTVQLIALHYGYDVKNSPSEMEYASAVLMEIMTKGKVSDTGGLNEVIGKMMAEAELTSLKSALTKGTNYSQMAINGGLQQLYVKIRAITNKAAADALNKAQTKGIENGALKKILEQLSKNMSKSAGAKAVPAASAVLSSLIDVYQINKVLKNANMIYHKRFLIDKGLMGNESGNRYSDIIDVEIVEIEQ